MPYSSLLSEVRGKFEGIISLIEFLDQKFQEHGKDWAEDVDYKDFDFKKIAEQIQNQAKTKYWYIPLSCNYLVLLIYSLIEDTLNRICKEIEQNLHLNISLNDFAGKGIERATNYIIKVAGIENVRNHESWKDIKRWSIVRNAIAHSNCRIDDVIKIEEVAKIVNIDKSSGAIVLNFNNVKKFYETLKSYLEYVFRLLI